MTRLDQNRAKGLLAAHLGGGLRPADIHNVIVWGNHSPSMVPDTRYATVSATASAGHVVESLVSRVKDAGWLRGDFMKAVQQRGAVVIAKRGASSAASAASAVCDHMRDWLFGSHGEIVSMGIHTSAFGRVGAADYELDDDLVFSLPVVCLGDGVVRVVHDLSIDAPTKALLAATEAELQAERAAAFGGSRKRR